MLWDVSQGRHDKHVFVGNSLYEPIPVGGSPTAPTVSTRKSTAFAPTGADCGLRRVQRVALALEDLATLGGGDTGVADKARGVVGAWSRKSRSA